MRKPKGWIIVPRYDHGEWAGPVSDLTEVESHPDGGSIIYPRGADTDGDGVHTALDVREAATVIAEALDGPAPAPPSRLERALTIIDRLLQTAALAGIAAAKLELLGEPGDDANAVSEATLFLAECRGVDDA